MHLRSYKQDSPHVPSSSTVVKAKRRRRNPPDDTHSLTFIVTTNPTQFRNKGNQKDVRSQAMRYFRRGQRLLAKEERAAAAPPVDNSGSPSRTSQNIPRPPILFPSDEVGQHKHCVDLSMCPLGLYENSAPALERTLEVTAHRTVQNSGLNKPSISTVAGRAFISGHQQPMAGMPLDGFDPHHGQYLAEGSPNDILPIDTNLDTASEPLFFILTRIFTTESTLTEWSPIMCGDPDLVSSATVLAAAWDDMQKGIPGESGRTALLKRETAAMLDRQETNQDTQSINTAITMMLHLMAAEMWSSYESMLCVYEAKVIRFITALGGMNRLQDSTVAESAAAHYYHSAIIRGVGQYKIFRDWTMQELPKGSTAALHESPLFCQAENFETINSNICSPVTLRILHEMRYLTDMFIATYSPHMDGHIRDEDVDEQQRSNAFVEYGPRSIALLGHISCLPSAEEQGHPGSEDWIYETCRLAALIYTKAVVGLEPFSVIGNFDNSNGFLESARWQSTHLGSRQSHMNPLPEQLLRALCKTDLANSWKDMIGVLYWVCAVGAAAARTPAGTDNTLQTMTCNREQSHPVWVRRCLAMHATRTMVLLVAMHPTPTLMAQKKLYRVQEIIRKASAP